MIHFESMAHFAEYLLKATAGEAIALHEGLEKCAKLVEKTAKEEIGEYQAAAGPFPAWAELADSTKEERVRLGFTEDDPLLRTGALRDSITHETNGLEAVIGSTSPVMAYMEFGTATIPARPAIGPAAYRNKERIQSIIGAAAISGYFAGVPIHPNLGYEMGLSE